MKQLVINTDEKTHAWIKGMAKAEGRTIGRQVLALLGIARDATAKHSKVTWASSGNAIGEEDSK